MTVPDENAWRRSWEELDIAPPVGAYSELLRQYGEPSRAYHNLQHIGECFEVWGRVKSRAAHPAEIEVALWYHDVIYDTHRSDNELQSAAQAVDALTSQSADVGRIKRVYELILATEHSQPPKIGDQALMVDIDLSILAANESRFDEYERQIREEYAWVEPSRFRVGRAKVLRSFLDRPRIYSTKALSELEGRARANITRSLRLLEA